jgi:hypothetical protein
MIVLKILSILMIDIIKVVIILFDMRFLKQSSDFFLSVVDLVNESITVFYEIIEDENQRL